MTGRTPRVAGVRLAASVFAIATISGCVSTPPAGLAECPESGTARFDGIPIASQQEHRRATQFGPSSADSCVVYVLRVRHSWLGSKVREPQAVSGGQGVAVLTEVGLLRDLPPSDWQLVSLLGNRALAIAQNVYAMWEVPSGSYLLRAYWRSRSAFPTSLEFNCAAGEARFYALEPRGFDMAARLEELDPGTAKVKVRSSLRSAGYFVSDRPSFRDCQPKE